MTYGRKGGTSATAGKQSELVDFDGHRVRCFKGQRWAVISQDDERDKPLIQKFPTEAKAREVWRSIMSLYGSDGREPFVCYVVEGKLVESRSSKSAQT